MSLFNQGWFSLTLHIDLVEVSFEHLGDYLKYDVGLIYQFLVLWIVAIESTQRLKQATFNNGEVYVAGPVLTSGQPIREGNFTLRISAIRCGLHTFERVDMLLHHRLM